MYDDEFWKKDDYEYNNLLCQQCYNKLYCNCAKIEINDENNKKKHSTNHTGEFFFVLGAIFAVIIVIAMTLFFFFLR